MATAQVLTPNIMAHPIPHHRISCLEFLTGPNFTRLLAVGIKRTVGLQSLPGALEQPAVSCNICSFIPVHSIGSKLL